MAHARCFYHTPDYRQSRDAGDNEHTFPSYLANILSTILLFFYFILFFWWRMKSSLHDKHDVEKVLF